MSYFNYCLMDFDFLMKTGGIVDCQNSGEDYDTSQNLTGLWILLSESFFMLVLSIVFQRLNTTASLSPPKKNTRIQRPLTFSIQGFDITFRPNFNIHNLQIPSYIFVTNDHNAQIQDNETVSTSHSTASVLIVQNRPNDHSKPITPPHEPTDRPTPNHNPSISIDNTNTGATLSNPDLDSPSTSISQSTLELPNITISPILFQRSSRLMGFMFFSTIAQWSWSLSSAMGYRGTFPMLSILVSGNRDNGNVNNVHVDIGIERNWISVYRANTLGRLLASSTIFMGLSTGLLYCMRSYVRRSMQICRERREYAIISTKCNIR